MQKLLIKSITKEYRGHVLSLDGHNVLFEPHKHPTLRPQVGDIIEVYLADDLSTCKYYYLGVLICEWENTGQYELPSGEWMSVRTNHDTDPNTMYDTVNTEVSSTPIMDFSRGEISPTDATDILPDDGVTTLDDLMKEKHDDTPLVGVKFKYTW